MLRNTDEMGGDVLASNVRSILYYTRREECDGGLGLIIDLYLNPSGRITVCVYALQMP